MFFNRLSIMLLLIATFYIKRLLATNDPFIDVDEGEDDPMSKRQIDPGDDDSMSKRQIAGSHKSIQHPPNSSSYFVPGIHVPIGIDRLKATTKAPRRIVPEIIETTMQNEPSSTEETTLPPPVVRKLPPPTLPPPPPRQKYVPRPTTTSIPKQLPFEAYEVGQPWLTKKSTLYDECGVTKTCFGFPEGCIGKEKCIMSMALWLDDGATHSSDSYVNIALAATNPASRGYVSVGFSDDHYMGDDFVLSCFHAPSGPQVFMRQSHNNRYYQNHQIPQNTKSSSSLSYIIVGYAQMNGVLTCILKLDMKGTYHVEGHDHDYDLFYNKHHILMAFGKYNDDVGTGFGRLERHYAAVSTTDSERLEELLEKPKILHVYHSIFIEWHVITEILVHAFLIPASIIMAKYGQEAFSQTVKGIPMCFVVHISMTVIAVFLSVIGVVAISKEVGWESHMPVAKAHSILGIFIYIFYFFSCIIGTYLAIKQNNNLENYYIGHVNIFRWCHWIIGNVIVLIGMLLLLFAPEMKRAFVPCIFRLLAGLLIFVHLLTVVIMSFHTYWLSTTLGSQIGFQLACYGPIVPFEPESDDIKNFKDLEAWAGRRRAVIFYFIATAIICAGMIGLMMFPMILCFTPY